MESGFIVTPNCIGSNSINSYIINPSRGTFSFLDGIDETSEMIAQNKGNHLPKQPPTIHLNVKRVLYHNPATIVFWNDDTKTVVKCMSGEPFEKYAGFCAALAKKVFGSTSKAKKTSDAKEKHVKIETDFGKDT